VAAGANHFPTDRRTTLPFQISNSIRGPPRPKGGVPGLGMARRFNRGANRSGEGIRGNPAGVRHGNWGKDKAGASTGVTHRGGIPNRRFRRNQKRKDP